MKEKRPARSFKHASKKVEHEDNPFVIPAKITQKRYETHRQSVQSNAETVKIWDFGFGNRSKTYVYNEPNNVAKELKSVCDTNLSGGHVKLLLDESFDKRVGDIEKID